MTWLLNEDAAVKAKFRGLTVTDANHPTGTPVTVRFREPETEVADATFPSIVIDQPSLSKADDREHRGVTTLPYVPDGVDAAGVTYVDPVTGVVTPWDVNTDFDVTVSPFKTQDHPVPYNLDYQITVYVRKQSHLTQILDALSAIDRIPPRFGYIEVPQDGTVRTLEVLAGPHIEADRDKDGKRIFRAVYAIRVPSELDLYGAAQIAHYADTVAVQVTETNV